MFRGKKGRSSYGLPFSRRGRQDSEDHCSRIKELFQWTITFTLRLVQSDVMWLMRPSWRITQSPVKKTSRGRWAVRSEFTGPVYVSERTDSLSTLSTAWTTKENESSQIIDDESSTRRWIFEHKNDLYAATQRASGHVTDIQTSDPRDNDVATSMTFAARVNLVGVRVSTGAMQSRRQNRKRQTISVLRMNLTAVEEPRRGSSYFFPYEIERMLNMIESSVNSWN